MSKLTSKSTGSPSAGDDRATRATGLGLAAILLWSGLALLSAETKGIPPFELLALAFGIACFGGLIVLALQGRDAIARLRQPAAAWTTAFAGLFLYHALYFYALASAPAAKASLIAYLWPLFIVLLAAARRGARLRWHNLAGALTGLAGTALLFLDKPAASDAATNAPAGYAAAFACAIVWSVYSVANRRFATVPSEMLIGVCGGVCAAGASAHALIEATAWPDAGQWLAIVLIGLGPTGLAFLAWDHATKHGNLQLLGALSYIAPLLSTGLLVVAGRAPPTVPLALAALLVVGGAIVASLPGPHASNAGSQSPRDP